MIEIIANRITGNQYSRLRDFSEASLGVVDSESVVEECETLIQQYLHQQLVSNQSEFLVIAGIPFSGKSSYIEQFLKIETSEYLFISFDDIMQKLSVYQSLMQSRGPEIAFKQTELLARIVGYELLHRAVETRIPLILEHSSTLKEHVELYRVIRDFYGYQIEMTLMDVSLDVAAQRAYEFNEQRDGNRHTPVHYLQERHDKLQELIPEYEALMPVNRILG